MLYSNTAKTQLIQCIVSGYSSHYKYLYASWGIKQQWKQGMVLQKQWMTNDDIMSEYSHTWKMVC